MKKLLLIALLLPTIALAQDVDSLKRYNDRYTKSAISAFTYNRLHTLINNMLTLIGQGGGGGGTTVAMRSNGGYIQVQYNGGTWNNLVALSELTGPQGIQGTPGTNGTDGREIELTTTATHIQWRYVGGTYTNLVALADLRGADGSDATATTDAAALITGVLSNDRLQNIPLSKLAQSGAVAGSVIKWNGSAWAIGTDNTGGGGGAVNSVNSQQGDVVLNQDNIADGVTYKQYSQTEKTKLAGIEAGASNARANHTGVQAQSTITNLTTDLAARLNISDTSTMLTAYRNGLNARVRYTDTADMLLPYANKINTKYGASDTSALLTAYRNAINARVKYTDTAGMLAAYWQALQDSVDVPVDAYPTLGSTIPASSGGTREKLDSIIANMGAGGGGAVDATITDGGTNPVQGNAIFDALALKANLTALRDSIANIWTFRQEFDIRRYGAVGDGTHDDGPAIQAAYNAAVLVRGVVFWPKPPVNWRVNNTIVITPPSGNEVYVDTRGQSNGTTTIQYKGPANTALFDLNGIRSSNWQGLTIWLDQVDGQFAFDLDTKVTATSVSFNNFVDIQVFTYSTNQKGWRIGHVSANGADISNNHWGNCLVYGHLNVVRTGTIGWHIEGSNTLNMAWTLPFTAFMEKGFSNVSGAGATSTGNGAWWFYGFGTSRNALDIEIGNAQSYVFSGGRFESGQRVLSVTNGAVSPSIVFQSTEINDYNPSDGILFRMDMPGTLMLNGVNINSDSYSPYTNQMIKAYGGGSGAGIGRIIVDGGAIEASDPFYSLNNNATPWRLYVRGVARLDSTASGLMATSMMTDVNPEKSRLDTLIPNIYSAIATATGGGITGVGTFSGTSTPNGLSVSGSNILLHTADATNPGAMTPTMYNQLLSKVTSTWATGTVTVNLNYAQHDIDITAAGARTLAFSNVLSTRKAVMYIDNTSGGTVTLTLPSNSFVQNISTGVYGSATSVVLAQGKTILTLTNYKSSGTSYWFNY